MSPVLTVVLLLVAIFALLVCVAQCVVVVMLLKELRLFRESALRTPRPVSRRRAADRAEEPEPPAKAPAGSAEPKPEDDPELLAVLAAACVAALGRPVRIRSVRPAYSPARSTSNWSGAGRLSLHASHATRKAL